MFCFTMSKTDLRFISLFESFLARFSDFFFLLLGKTSLVHRYTFRYFGNPFLSYLTDKHRNNSNRGRWKRIRMLCFLLFLLLSQASCDLQPPMPSAYYAHESRSWLSRFNSASSPIPQKKLWFIDEDNLIHKKREEIMRENVDWKSTNPQALILSAKNALASDIFPSSQYLVDNFTLCLPNRIVSKAEILESLKYFDPATVYSYWNPRFYNFHVDPFNIFKVWVTSAPLIIRARHRSKFQTSNDSMTKTNTSMNESHARTMLELPPSAISLTFNEAGLIKSMTMGYDMGIDVDAFRNKPHFVGRRFFSRSLPHSSPVLHALDTSPKAKLSRFFKKVKSMICSSIHEAKHVIVEAVKRFPVVKTRGKE